MRERIYMKKNCYGISLISLIITIIVIIILAAIVIYNGYNTLDDARFAKFVSEFDDYETRVRSTAMDKKTQLSIDGNNVSDKVLYYTLATGETVSDEDEIIPTGFVSEINKELLPDNISGNEYYEIVDSADNNVRKPKTFYSENEKIYITDLGEVFTLPRISKRETKSK